MTREVEYSTEVTKLRHQKYQWASRVITVMWALLTVCFTILIAVSFVQSQWLGDTEKSPGVGFFGLYEYCETLQVDGDYSCRGDFMSFKSILNDSFRAASMLVGTSALLFIISVVCILLFLFLKADKVLKICGWLQLIGALSIAAGCIVYPNGWNDPAVRKVCGKETGRYHLGRCNIRWAYILAIVLIFDGFVLSFLAFMLARRQANLLPKHKEEKSSGITNGGFSPNDSGPLYVINPVMFPPEEKQPQHLSTISGPYGHEDCLQEIDLGNRNVLEAYDKDQDIRL